MTYPEQDPNAFLMKGGTKSASFPTPGTTVGGIIVSPPTLEQQSTYVKKGSGKSPKLKFWDDGEPMMQLVVEVQTDERDPEREEDDGVRAFHIKWRLQKAVQRAVKTARAQGLQVGGYLAITFTHADGPEDNDPKNYTAVYRPPATQAANDFLNQPDRDQAPAPRPAAPAPAPQRPAPAPATQQPAAAPTGPPAGVDLSALDPATRALVEQSMSQAGSPIPF